MKGVLIFCGGVLTGAAATLGVLTAISKRRDKNDLKIEEARSDDWVEYKPEETSEKKEEPEETPEKKEEAEEDEESDMKEDINVNMATEHNKIINDYVAENREQPERYLDPWIMTEEEWKLSPYEKQYCTWFLKDDILVDENGTIIMDDRCGDNFRDICTTAGVVHVCNEELEVNFEILLEPTDTYEDMMTDDSFFDE